jgi:hypothetical protein
MQDIEGKKGKRIYWAAFISPRRSNSFKLTSIQRDSSVELQFRTMRLWILGGTHTFNYVTWAEQL